MRGCVDFGGGEMLFEGLGEGGAEGFWGGVAGFEFFNFA